MLNHLNIMSLFPHLHQLLQRFLAKTYEICSFVKTLLSYEYVRSDYLRHLEMKMMSSTSRWTLNWLRLRPAARKEVTCCLAGSNSIVDTHSTFVQCPPSHQPKCPLPGLTPPPLHPLGFHENRLSFQEFIPVWLMGLRVSTRLTLG
jgi:hypothetical protein